MPRKNPPSAAKDPEPITVRIPTALQMLGLSRSKFYMLVADGEFDIVKVGRCTLVLVASLPALWSGNGAMRAREYRTPNRIAAASTRVGLSCALAINPLWVEARASCIGLMTGRGA